MAGISRTVLECCEAALFVRFSRVLPLIAEW